MILSFRFSVCIIALLLSHLWGGLALADSSGARSPGVVATSTASGGSHDWIDISNVMVEDGNEALGPEWMYTLGAAIDHDIKIIKNGVIGLEDKSTLVTWTSSSTYATYGGETDLWGETWTPSDINSSNFGVAFSIMDNHDAGVTSYYIQATNFGFTIPSDATIDGLKFEIKRRAPLVGSFPFVEITPRVDYVRLTVYYTPNTAPSVSSLGPTTLLDGSASNNALPTFTFITADNESDQVAYEITIDDSSDFSSPVYQATSTYAAPGSVSTTTLALPDGEYYWRVLVGDGNATSSYVTANSGAIAFLINTYVSPSPELQTSGSRVVRTSQVSVPLLSTPAPLSIEAREVLIREIHGQLRLLLQQLLELLNSRLSL